MLLDLFYLVALLAAAPYLAWQGLVAGKRRGGWRQKLWGLVPRRETASPCLWLHAVSVGEVNLLAPLVEEFERRHPAWQCVISTTTTAGYQLACRKFAPRTVFYCPLDFSWATRRAMGRVRPSLLVLVELELWPNLIRAARRAGARVAVINGRLSERSYRGYRRLAPLVARWLKRLDLVAVQSPEFAERFRSLGAPPERVKVTGSIKFDGAARDRDHPRIRGLAQLAGFGAGDVVFLAGSTQHPEESLALEAFRRLSAAHPSLRLVIVPRHPERFDAVAELIEQTGLPWQRRTRLEHEGPRRDARVLLVDTVGELGAWWGTAAIAFVGGSLGQRGGQNMIEPAGYGAAIAVGPNTWNFRDVVAQLAARDALCIVSSGDELAAFVARMLEDPPLRAALGRRAQRVVIEQAGATLRTADLIDELLAAAIPLERTPDRQAA